jgi:hypothetical protein
LEELFKRNANFVKSVELKVEAARVVPSAIVEPVIAPPVVKVSSEREEIIRVASFEAHQRRAIHERETYATSVLVRLKATLSQKEPVAPFRAESDGTSQTIRRVRPHA